MIQFWVGMDGADATTNLLVRHVQPVEVIPAIRTRFATDQLYSAKLVTVLISKLRETNSFGVIILPALIMRFHDVENVSIGARANDN